MMKINKPNLAIIGCGWLGSHILPTLKKHFSLLATTAHQSSAQQLSIPAYVYDWTIDKLPKNVLMAEYFLIAIPPTAGGYANYANNMQRLAADLPKDKLIILISSSGIYPATPGIYHEDSLLNEDNAIYQAEQVICNTTQTYVVLRCSGLFGDKRLNGQTYFGQIYDKPNKRLNLIHYQDIANAILAIIDQYTKPNIFNLSHPKHPFRHDYYRAQANLRQQPQPIFINTTIEEDRIIDGDKITQVLDFQYLHPPTCSV